MQPPDQSLHNIDMKLPPEPVKKSSKKIVIVASIILLALIVGAAVMLTANKQEKAVTDNAETEEPVKQEKKRVRLIASGDMIPHDAINLAAKQEDGSYKYSHMFGDMKRFFDNADIRFCNQAVLGGGVEYGVSGYPKFNSPTEFARDLAELGCNVVNTGSNHTNDFGQEVISASVEAWQGLPGVLAVAGSNAKPSDVQKIHYFENKGIKFAFVSYTTYSNEPSPNGWSITMYNEERARQQLAEARTQADIVIVSMRWGTEYSADINPQQRTLAPQLANFGADIILGHGPHVLEPVQQLTLDDGREAYVWYSLGNFLNAQLEPETLFNGIAVMDIDPETKQIAPPQFLPVYMHYEWSESDKRAGKLLTRSNFNMFTFDDASEPLAKSPNDTTLEAQRQRIEATLNKLTTIKLISKDEYLQS